MLDFLFKPSIEKLTKEALDDARRGLLMAQSQVEYWGAMAAFHSAASTRLELLVPVAEQIAETTSLHWNVTGPIEPTVAEEPKTRKRRAGELAAV